MFNESFKALGDPIRLKIIELLREGKLSAGDISSKFKITSASISYHLKILKEADLIREQKYKNFIYYELNLSVFEELIFWLKKGDKNEKI
ncbi:autorepressor SdpR family transcription factor [Oceanivirga salmonicida]|uniref:autorepressor SdpR family transcription factor n=1 Tax=Oceanivirga salmonicida TaxID=1769291 RepID=UPI000A61AAE7|nr:autorepressor SdpR family transcription factor [Oceanivirga salmonicida]